MNKNLKLFVKNFARYKLAESLKVDPNHIEFSSYFNPFSPYDLKFGKYTYKIKFSNPVSVAENKKGKVWDFDLRNDEWRDGKPIKTPTTDPECDYYLLVGMVDDIPSAIYRILSKDLSVSHVRISVDGFSKYQAYEI